MGAGLEGCGAIVTGAAGGIGRAVADALTLARARVYLIDLHEEALSRISRELGETSSFTAFDLTDIAGHDRLVRAAAEATGGVDILVHCAAVIRRLEVNEVTEEDWDFQHTINLKASFFLNRAVAEFMRAEGTSGRIVNFASQAWWTGGVGGSVAYGASKGGIVSMTRGLARTYGPDGIRINAISPGVVRTEMLLRDLSEATLESIVTQTPLGYIADPAELAAVAVFLVSDHASYITGATINASGGYLLY